MKALLRAEIIVDGWKSEEDKEVVTRILYVEALISLPALPQKGDEILFEAPDQSYNIIDQAKVDCVYWACDEKHTNNMFPIIELEKVDYRGIDLEMSQTADDKLQSYIDELEKPARIGTVNWQRVK